MSRPHRFLRSSSILLATALCAPFAHAEIRLKNNNTNDLNLGASWTTTTPVPGFNDVTRWEATVTGANTVSLGADLSWLGISIVNPGGAVTIKSLDASNPPNTLTLGMAGIDMGTATQDLTISSNLTLLSSRRQIWNIAAGRSLTLDGATFTRSAGATLNLQGSGEVTTSNITNSNGIIGAWASHGTGTATRFATVTGGKIVAFTGTSAATAAGVTETAGTANYDVAAVGALGAGASFNTLRYTGATGTITGDFTANGIMNSGAGVLTFSGNATIGSSRELVVTGANNSITLSGTINDHPDGASGFTKTGTSSVTLSGNNGYTGATVVNGGVLRITHSNALGSTISGTVVVGGDNVGSGTTGNPALPGAQLLIEGNNLNIAEPLTLVGRGNNLTPRLLENSGGSNTVSGAIIADTAAGAVRFGTSSRLTITGGVIATNGGLLVLNPSGANGVIAFTTTPLNLGSGSFYLDTNGTVEVTVGGNTWGTTKIASGTIKLMAANVLPATSLLSIGVGYTTGGTLNLNGFSQTVGALEGNLTDDTRTITSATDATLTVNQSSNYTYNGKITGAVSLVKGGNATLTISGANTHTGDTRVNTGTLNVGSVNALQNSTLDTGTSGAQTVAFTVAGPNTYNIGGLKGADALSIGGNTISVGANNQDTTYSGTLTATSGGGVTKVGTGTLLVTGSLSGLSQLNVNTGTFGGTGNIAAPVNVAPDAGLQAGDGVIAGENLEINGNVTLSDNSVVKLTLGTGLSHSTLTRVGGTWSFDLNQAFTFSEAGVMTGVYENIITNLVGNEAGLASIGTWVITNEGYAGTFSFDGSNVDLTLTAVPEPSTLMSLLGGLALLAGFKRRRVMR